MLHDEVGLTDPVTSWVAGISLDDIGYAMVLFVLGVAGVGLLLAARQGGGSVDCQTARMTHGSAL